MALRIQAKRRLIALSSGVCAGLVGFVLAFVHWGPLSRLDLLLYDQMVRTAENPAAADHRVLLVHIDDESLGWVERELGAEWPWPREFYGVMAETLKRYGAKVVGFDLELAQAPSDTWSDLNYFASSVRRAGDVVLGASLTGGTPAPPPKVNYGVRLGHFTTAGEAWKAAVFLVSLGQKAWVVQAKAGADVWAGGFDDAAGAAGAIARLGPAISKVAPSLVGDLVKDGAVDRGAFTRSLQAKLTPRAGRLPAGASPVTGASLLARRFAIGPWPEKSARGQRVRRAKVATLPAALFLTVADDVGIVDQRPDADGVMRRYRPVTAFEGHLYPSLPLAMYLAGSGPDGRRDLAKVTPGELRIGGVDVPLDESGSVGIRYHGVHPYDGVKGGISAWRILRDAALERDGKKGTLDPSLFEGRYVIVSPSASGLRDQKPSPVSRLHLGADINAAALDGILSRRFVRRVPDWLEGLLTLLVAVGAVFVSFTAGSRFVPRTAGTVGELLRLLLRALFTLLAAALAFAPALALAWLLYAHYSIWTGLALPVIGAVVGVTLNYAVSEFLERRDRRAIHEALGIYTSHVVADLVASGGVHALDPIRDDVTVFFSDIQGFTSFSERMDPERLAQLLGAYLTAMTDVVLAHEGIVDKYIGDAIMAFWGWRETQTDHAARAVRCALAMQRRLAELNPSLVERYGVEIVARVGVNSGVAVVGNLGSEQKMNVTLMGDVVNLASRLEGANKAYGTRLMIGEDTYEAASGLLHVRELDLLRVKGKDHPVRVFEPLSLREDGEAEPAWLETWRAALERYRAADFAGARAGFEEVRRVRPDDGPTAVYLGRCDGFLAHPPPPDWDGVYIMTHK